MHLTLASVKEQVESCGHFLGENKVLWGKRRVCVCPGRTLCRNILQ